jgi:Zn-dependent oligopeptidase
VSTTIQNRPEVARLLEIVEQLSPSELKVIEHHVRAEKSKRKSALALTPDEKQRIATILQEVSAKSRDRYASLIQRQRDTVLNEDEQEELVRLSDWIELVEVRRLEYLAELAAHRGVPLLTLMDILGIKSPSYA